MKSLIVSSTVIFITIRNITQLTSEVLYSEELIYPQTHSFESL